MTTELATTKPPAKVVFNTCYGGFSLSDVGLKLARQLSGSSDWGGDGCKFRHEYSEKEQRDMPQGDYFYKSFYPEVDRHDPILVQVVEQLGERAGGPCAKLSIAQLQGRRYRIDEYDGRETVVEPDDQDWIEV